MHGETDAGGDALHAFIFGEDFGDDAFELFVAAKLYQTGQQFGAKTCALVLIADQMANSASRLPWSLVN